MVILLMVLVAGKCQLIQVEKAPTHQAGLDVFDINYRELYVNPTELVFEDTPEHMDIPEREYANYGYIVKQINEYSENNVKLICENIPQHNFRKIKKYGLINLAQRSIM